MKIQGIIEAKNLGKSGVSEFGAWQVHEFTINGKRYSTFKQSVYDMFSVGQSVEMEGETTEKGFNMKSMKLVEGDVVKVEKVAPKSSNGANPYAKDPVGLAVDIFVASIQDAIVNGVVVNSDNVIELMKQSINLVKQARKAFE